MNLPRYTMGVGDRFGRQGAAQLKAFVWARAEGIDVTPVWNKSHREHAITGTGPESVRAEADAAVQRLGWKKPYFVDADHIRMDTVGEYIASSDFFTIDVADKIGAPCDASEFGLIVEGFERITAQFPGALSGVQPVDQIVSHYAAAVHEAKAIYDKIALLKGSNDFVIEVSMDETESPQSGLEFFTILILISRVGIPIQTIAPKFPGRFNKGVDYAGDLDAFADTFEKMVQMVQIASRQFGLPDNLKLSVHTGSDKFSLYPVMRSILKKHDAGVHLKTAGTTWLEELAALAVAGDDGLAVARDVYRIAYERRVELCGPYKAVIDIDDRALPEPGIVDSWDGVAFAAMLRHDPASSAYNPNARQLLHLGFKIAAEMGDRFTQALDAHAEVIAPNVTENLLERHIRPLFSGL